MTRKRTNWTSEQDLILRNLVKNLGIRKWQEVSQQLKQLSKLPKKTPQQCKQRWTKHLSPKINKNPWQDQEVKIIFDKHRQYGNKWTQISRFVSHRSDNDVKNHFYNALRKGIRKICKVLRIPDCTRRVRQIKPKDLSSKIHQSAKKQNNKQLFHNQIYQILFQFSRENNNQQLKQKASDQNYNKLMRQIIRQLEINDEKTSQNINLTQLVSQEQCSSSEQQQASQKVTKVNTRSKKQVEGEQQIKIVKKKLSKQIQKTKKEQKGQKLKNQKTQSNIQEGIFQQVLSESQQCHQQDNQYHKKNIKSILIPSQKKLNASENKLGYFSNRGVSISEFQINNNPYGFPYSNNLLVSSIIYNKNALPPNLFESAEPLFGEPLFKSTSK